jgi:hypothetical protein
VSRQCIARVLAKPVLTPPTPPADAALPLSRKKGIDMEDGDDDDFGVEAKARREYAALSSPVGPGDLVSAAAVSAGAAAAGAGADLDGVFRILSAAKCSVCSCARGAACACESCGKGASCSLACDAIRVDTATPSAARVRVSLNAVARTASVAASSARAGPVFRVGDSVQLNPRVTLTSARCLGNAEDGTVGVISAVTSAVRGVRVTVADDTDSYDWTELLLVARGADAVASLSALQRAPTVGTSDDVLRALRESVALQGPLLSVDDKRRVLGDALLRRVVRIHPQFAGKIVAHICETADADAIVGLLESSARDSLRALVRRASDAVQTLDHAYAAAASVFRASSAGGPPLTPRPTSNDASSASTATPATTATTAADAGARKSLEGGSLSGASLGGADGAPTVVRALSLKELLTRVDVMGNSAAHYAAFLQLPLSLAALESAGVSPFAASADPGWTPRSISAQIFTRRAAALHRDLTMRPTAVGGVPGALAAACRAAAAHGGEDGGSRSAEAAWVARWEGGADDENLRAGIAALRAGDVDDATFFCNEAVNNGVVDALPYLALAYSASNNIPLVRVCVANYVDSFKGGAAAHDFDPAIFFAVYENDAPKGRTKPPRYALQRAADGLRALRHFDAVAAALLADPSLHTLDATIPAEVVTAVEDAFDEEAAADIFDEELAATDADAPEVLWEELRAAPDSRPCPALSKIMRMTGLRNVKNMALNLYMTITMREMLKRVNGGAELDVDDGCNMTFVGNPGVS